MADFDYERFEGLWYEIYKDKGHYAIRNQKCTESTYKKTWFGDNMKLKRKYKRKFWHWDILWNAFPNIVDKLTWERFYNPIFFNKDDSDYIKHIPYPVPFFNPVRYGNIYTNEHTIIATDYDDYAVVYGCSVVFSIFKFSFATFMSRETNPGSKGLTAAKKKLNEIEYPYVDMWLNSGEECGWGAAPTLDN